VIIGYWDIRGLVEPAKLLLEYGGVPYEDRKHQMTKDCWLEYKQGLGFDFPNLPYYQEGDIKITQSRAIIKHLGRKFGLDGESLAGKAQIDMMIDQAGDYIQKCAGLCYLPNFCDQLKEDWIAGKGDFTSLGPLSTRITPLQNKLGEDDWFVENKLSVADFAMWELIDVHRLLFPGCLEKFGKLENFMERFAKLPGVKEYLNSPRYRPFPIWSVRAKYGYDRI